MVVANETSRAGASGSAPGAWGEGLGYPEWVQGLLPAMHDGFKAVNKYVGVPALKMGLGSFTVWWLRGRRRTNR